MTRGRSGPRAVLSAALVLFGASPGCYLSHGLGLGDDAGPAADVPIARDVPPPSAIVWVLVHPTTAPLGPGIFRVDETRGEILRHLPLPPGVESPHGLAWDGTSLWLLSWEPSGTFELDPETGAVRSRIEGFRGEGIAVDADGTLVCSCIRDGSAELRAFRFARDGAVLGSVPIFEVVVQDLVIARGETFYLVNDGFDRVMRLGPDGIATELGRSYFEAPYSLGFDGTSLAIAMDGRIVRIDPATGAATYAAFPLTGYLTAIAFER